MAEPRRPNSIPGYEHPDSNSISDSARGGVYKTFSDVFVIKNSFWALAYTQL